MEPSLKAFYRRIQAWFEPLAVLLFVITLTVVGVGQFSSQIHWVEGCGLKNTESL